MRKLVSLLLLCALLTGCGQQVPPEVAPEPPDAMTETEVLAAYAQAAEVYDWFDMASLPVSGRTAEADGQTYQMVDCDGLETYADLESKVRACFAPALADTILSGSANYRDIGGKLCTLGGARGGNVYLLGRTETAEQVDQDHWTVTLTFYADSYEWERPQAVVGYSRKTVDYENTPDGWRFTSFCPSDALELDAETVFSFSYDPEHFLEAEQTMADWSDLKLACWLLHSDALSEGAFYLLAHRFLERPEDILRVLAQLDGSPYQTAYPHVDGIIAGPGYSAANFYREDRADFLEILDTLHPEDLVEQAVLDKIRAAYASASSGSEEPPIDAEFSFIVPGDKQVLTLGPQEGTRPWGYNLGLGTEYFRSGYDNTTKVRAVAYPNIHLVYSIDPDDGTEYLFRMTTSAHYDRSGGDYCTFRSFYCGYDLDHLKSVYSHAEKLEPFESDTYDACYVYEPGGDAFRKRILFYIKDDVVASIEMEDPAKRARPLD